MWAESYTVQCALLVQHLSLLPSVDLPVGPHTYNVISDLFGIGTRVRVNVLKILMVRVILI